MSDPSCTQIHSRPYRIGTDSLAGMRLGLLFASKKIVDELWKVKDSYNLDRLAISAGAASLRDTAWTATPLQANHSC